MPPREASTPPAWVRAAIGAIVGFLGATVLAVLIACLALLLTLAAPGLGSDIRRGGDAHRVQLRRRDRDHGMEGGARCSRQDLHLDGHWLENDFSFNQPRKVGVDG